VARNLPLVFALALGGGLLVEHGAKLFAGTFSGGDSAPGDGGSGAAPDPSAAGLSKGPLSEEQARAAVQEGLALAFQHTGDPRLRPTAANVDLVLGRARQESGLNPSIVNTWDTNAQQGHPSIGFLQTIQSTFDSFAVPGHHDIRNAVDNTAAAAIYMVHRYGHLVGPGQGGY
jgi:hypothetical protein